MSMTRAVIFVGFVFLIAEVLRWFYFCHFPSWPLFIAATILLVIGGLVRLLGHSRGNLEPRPFDAAPIWIAGKEAESLTTIFNVVRGHAVDTMQWYLRAKEGSKIGARCVRLGAIILAAGAGIIPTLSQMQLSQTNGRPLVEPGWATVALATAALLVLLDQFFGFSSAWMRYMGTEMLIRRSFDEFQFDWEIEKSSWTNGTPPPAQIPIVLGRFRTFITQVNAAVEQETAAWIADFKTTLMTLDQSVKGKIETASPGGVNLEVTNGDQLNGGWTLSIDQGTPQTRTGKTAALGGLAPGTHVLTIIESKAPNGQNAKRTERAVVVTANDNVAVQVTAT